MTITKKEVRTDKFEEDNCRWNGYHEDVYFCSNCNIELYREIFNNKGHCFGSASILKTGEAPKYCPNCGTAVHLTEENFYKEESICCLEGEKI